jgi:hypothetical protein
VLTSQQSPTEPCGRGDIPVCCTLRAFVRAALWILTTLPEASLAWNHCCSAGQKRDSLLVAHHCCKHSSQEEATQQEQMAEMPK